MTTSDAPKSTVLPLIWLSAAGADGLVVHLDAELLGILVEHLEIQRRRGRRAGPHELEILRKTGPAKGDDQGSGHEKPRYLHWVLLL